MLSVKGAPRGPRSKPINEKTPPPPRERKLLVLNAALLSFLHSWCLFFLIHNIWRTKEHSSKIIYEANLYNAKTIFVQAPGFEKQFLKLEMGTGKHTTFGEIFLITMHCISVWWLNDACNIILKISQTHRPLLPTFHTDKNLSHAGRALGYILVI